MSWEHQSHSQHLAAAPPPLPPAHTRPGFQQTLSHPTPDNELLFQAFEWHTKSEPPPPDQTHSNASHWSRLARILPSLNNLGVTSVWLPPGCKANNPQGNGYDCYDIWDLGEFDQKWARSTKWGSREELRDLIDIATRLRGPGGHGGVELIWDAVLSHKTAGDATDESWAVEVDPSDRRLEICAPKKIEAWLKYDFPGRERQGMKYSPLKWRAEHFNGTDWDQSAQRNAIYKLIDDPATFPRPNEQQIPIPQNAIKGFNRLAKFAGAVKNVLAEQQYVPPQRPGKGWAEDVDKEHGNNDYLMFSNIWYGHPEVRRDVLRWGEWMVRDVGIQGFRLDAVQHISWSFVQDWIATVQNTSRQRFGREAFVVGEVWSGEVSRLTTWLDAVTPPGCPHRLALAFDSPLVYNFSRVSEDVRRGSKSADLRTLLSGPGPSEKAALVSLRPHQAVTVVTNHDTQPGQTSFTPMDPGLKALFYAFTLLRREGHPCVFWGDLYGTLGNKSEPPSCRIPLDPETGSLTRPLLPSLMLARKLFAYGSQTDYMDSMSCIGWTRSGTHDRPGCVVILSIVKIGKWTTKTMRAGKPGEKWVDILSEEPERRPEVVIDEEGCGKFAVRGRGVGVYVREDLLRRAEWPVGFDHNVYAL